MLRDFPCADVTWLSRFPSEMEMLFARSPQGGADSALIGGGLKMWAAKIVKENKEKQIQFVLISPSAADRGDFLFLGKGEKRTLMASSHSGHPKEHTFTQIILENGAKLKIEGNAVVRCGGNVIMLVMLRLPPSATVFP